jgi:hypothetical protein
MDTLFSSQSQPTQKKKTQKTATSKYDYPGLILDRPFLHLCCGAKGSGKTALCVRLLTTSYRHRFTEITIVSPTFRSQFDGIWSRLSPEGIDVHEELTEAFIDSYLERVSKNKQPKLLICDDLGEEFRKVNQRKINQLVSNSRHYGLSFIFLHQKIVQSPPIVRSQADIICMFSSSSYQEIECLWTLVATVDKKTFRRMFAECTQKPFSFMVSTVTRGGLLKFYHSDFKTEIKPYIKE